MMSCNHLPQDEEEYMDIFRRYQRNCIVTGASCFGVGVVSLHPIHGLHAIELRFAIGVHLETNPIPTNGSRQFFHTMLAIGKLRRARKNIDGNESDSLLETY
jgi:hypothetical protein